MQRKLNILALKLFNELKNSYYYVIMRGSFLIKI